MKIRLSLEIPRPEETHTKTDYGKSNPSGRGISRLSRIFERRRGPRITDRGEPWRNRHPRLTPQKPQNFNYEMIKTKPLHFYRTNGHKTHFEHLSSKSSKMGVETGVKISSNPPNTPLKPHGGYEKIDPKIATWLRQAFFGHFLKF